MIKQIIFKKKDTPEEIIINFNERFNIIVGPKGGGKSTLFELLIALEDNSIWEETIKTLKAFKLEVKKVILSNNEEILFEQLNKINKSAYKEMLITKNNVVYQDDDIKKNLTNQNFFNVEKNNFCDELLKSKEISNLEDFYNQIYETSNKIIDLVENEEWNKIPWNLTFKINEKAIENKLKILTNLNYNNNNLLNYLDEEIIKNKDFIKQIKKYIEISSKYFSYSKFNEKDDDINDIKNIQNAFIDIDDEIKIILNNINNKNQSLLNLLEKKIYKLNKFKLAITCFKNSFDQTIKLIKDSSINLKISTYESNALNYFKSVGKYFARFSQEFNKLYNDEVILKLNEEKKCESNNDIVLKLNEEINLDEETKENLLMQILYKPTRNSNFISSWIEMLWNKHSSNSNKGKKKILNYLKEKILLKKIKIFVNNKDYETLSLGQKSIIGLKYKLNNANNTNLYLDQPEDNLDNHTIANEVVKILNEKNPSYQCFVVTHNANIGILTNNPKNIIVANLEDFNNPYFNGQIVLFNQKNEGKDLTYFLEGGVDFLEQRYQIIKNEENKN